MLDVDEVATHLRCGRSTVYQLIATGELRRVKIGRLTRVPVDVVDDFIDRKLQEVVVDPWGLR